MECTELQVLVGRDYFYMICSIKHCN